MRIQRLSSLNQKRRDDQGAVAVLVAILLTVFSLLLAFALDIGNAYAQGRQLSVAADADALAAAAKVGEAIPPGVACTQSLLDGLTDSDGHVGAVAIARATAEAMNTSNSNPKVSGPVTVSVKCVKTSSTDASPNAVEVTVDNSRQVKTAIAGLIGIDHITPKSYAIAHYFRSKSGGGLRPWAVCNDTVLAAQQSHNTTFWTGIDYMPTTGVGPCETSAAGNWGAVDFNGGSNSATDLANWTKYGYPGPVQIPSTLPGDPGVSNSSELQDAFTKLVGQVVQFPAVTGFTCDTKNCNGNNAQFAALGIATLRVCGIVYGNNTYNIDPATNDVSDCWVTPSPPTNTSTKTTTATTTTSALMKAGTFDVQVSSPDFPTPPVSSNVSVSVSIDNAMKPQNNPKPLTADVTTFTSTTQVNLSAAPDLDVPAGTKVTITTTTTTGTGGFGPYVYQGNKWNLLDHIQFRWVNYSTDPYSGLNPSPCDFSDRLCIGVTQLWR